MIDFLVDVYGFIFCQVYACRSLPFHRFLNAVESIHIFRLPASIPCYAAILFYIFRLCIIPSCCFLKCFKFEKAIYHFQSVILYPILYPGFAFLGASSPLEAYSYSHSHWYCIVLYNVIRGILFQRKLKDPKCSITRYFEEQAFELEQAYIFRDSVHELVTWPLANAQGFCHQENLETSTFNRCRLLYNPVMRTRLRQGHWHFHMPIPV